MKQQQLTFEKGMTNVPSDLVCPDNALEYAEGMIFKDGEHHVIQAPKIFINDITVQGSHGTITLPGLYVYYVHKNNNINRYLCVRDNVDNKDILWGTVGANNTLTIVNNLHQVGSSDSVPFSGDITITSIGKTLIVSDDNGLHYFLLKSGDYQYLGEKIPEPIFNVKTDNVRPNKQSNVMSSGEYGDMIDFSGSVPRVPDDKQSAFDNFVAGLYSKNKTLVSEEKAFCEPFFIRVALEMYDGTYTCISNPILLLPTVHQNGMFWKFGSQINCTTYMEWLNIEQSQDYTDYSDLIKNVTLFITKGVALYNTSKAEQSISVLSEGDLYADYVDTSSYHQKTVTSNMGDVYRMIALRDDIDIEDDIKTSSVFYKLCDLGIKPTGSIHAEEKISSEKLKTLTTQPQLEYDDYYSHCQIIPKSLYVYNARLNAANISRSFFEGFKLFIPFGNSVYPYISNVDIYVRIKTESGNRVVKVAANGYGWQEFIWFYYPDTRADWVTISYTDNQDVRHTVLDVALTEHPGLNGSYYFYGLPTQNNVPVPHSTTTLGPTTNTTPEVLENQIATSEVNNPFVFKASGYNTIGAGKIIGMAAQTQALSQGQFGQYPLIVFTTEGIWAMSLNNTGLFVSVQPMSREVALESNPAITPVDGAIFFVSKKGLMLVDGSRVVCVSEQMKGKTGGLLPSGIGNLCDYLATAFIAYDYRDSLLWIFDGHYTLSTFTGSRHCYIYSIKSGTFATYDFGTYTQGSTEYEYIVKTAVNDYPDYLLQDKTTGKVYTLYGRDDINVEAATAKTYTAALKSRPMKLENALALKRIIQMMHTKDFYTVQQTVNGVTTYVTSGTLTFKMYGSNDAKNWWQLSSVRSTPWKYYRFEYTFEGLKATDTFAGTVVVTEEVRTNKMRTSQPITQ